MNTEEGLRAILNSFDGSEPGNLDECSSDDNSGLGSAVCTATRTADDSSVYCGPVDERTISESGDNDSRYENDLDYSPGSSVGIRSRSRCSITVPVYIDIGTSSEGSS